MTVTSGRVFTDSKSQEDIVIGETLARQLWPAHDAVGRRLEISRVMSGNVAAVIRDVPMPRIIGLSGGDIIKSEAVFVATRPREASSLASHRGFIPATLVVRLRVPDQLDQVLDLARSTDARALYVAELLSDRSARLNSPARMAASVMTIFALMAAMIAVAGVFGVMAFLVASRRREFGICLALGADQRRLQTQVLSTSLKLVTIGVVTGIGAAMLGERAVGASLPGVGGAGPLTYAVIGTVVILVTMVATWGPARQAARIDPTITLRAE